tara:strand:- start:68297 stop:69562 length:1266 start_codon:yes stop_codon:yes gene_type:complete
MRKNLVTIISIFLSIGFSSGCSDNQAPEENTAPVVVVSKITKEPITLSTDFVGKTEAIEKVELRARVEGFLEKQNFQSGSVVSANDVLFLIEKPPYQVEVDREKAGVAKAEADLALAKVNLLRMEELKKRQTVSQSELDKAVADEKAAIAFVAAAKAELDKAQLNLDYTNIIAPISGQIDKPALDVGNLVGPSSGILATINKMDPIYVNFFVSEVAFTQFMREQEKAQASQNRAQTNKLFTPFLLLPDGSEYPYEGNINFIDNKVDPGTGTILLRCDFPNPKKLLLPGQYVRVLVKLKKDSQAILVPQVAIISQQAGHSVLVVDSKGVVSSRKVTLGNKHGVKWIVLQGLKEGEWVITEGIQKVSPGLQVEARVAQTENTVQDGTEEDKELTQIESEAKSGLESEYEQKIDAEKPEQEETN